MKHSFEKPLRSSLVILLVLAMVVTIGMVGGVILAIRLPQITEENNASARYEAHELANRIDALMGMIETRVTLISEFSNLLGHTDQQIILDRVVRNNAFDAVYLIGPQHRVESAGVRPEKAQWRNELIGNDFSANKLYLSARAKGKPVWSDKYVSALAGSNTVGLAVPLGKQVIIAEIPTSYILDATRLSSGDPDLSTWILDLHGEVIVDTDGILGTGINNLMNLPLVDTAINGMTLPETFTYRGKQYHPVTARSQKIPWIFLAKMPAGLDNSHVKSTLLDMAALFGGSILISLLLASWWAGRITYPVHALMARARRVAEGNAPGDWPRGNITEFNQLSSDLAKMAASLQERELKFLAIFNDTPVAMIVTDPQNQHAIVEANEAWIQQFGHQKNSVIGKNGTELGLWKSAEEAARFMQSTYTHSDRLEVHLYHQNGQAILCLISSRLVYQTERPLVITAMEDITERRQMERELRKLTIELEHRVHQRTEALANTNNELNETLSSLRLTQTELVRAEKLAALGELVAGVAHELNTPIGNSLMAITTLSDQSRDFGLQIKEGMRRSALENYLSDVALAADIATRNLARAAELVSSFKQVAVDQTSSQRRAFDLKSVVDEILLTLRPTFKRTPYQVDCDIRADLHLDSYPGPLGQALTNLITNALLHGFDGRDHGKVLITAEPVDADWIRISVADDGHGIPEEWQNKIFTPFFTTKMGRGGTGLGLHIVHNTITQILGGNITLSSSPEQGATFTIKIPQKAPQLIKFDSI